MMNKNLKLNKNDKVSRILEAILDYAIESGVSDIHFSLLNQDKVAINFRIDGLLFEVSTLNKQKYDQLLAHIKVLANLDITKHNIPQDGVFTTTKSSCRVNICPTILGQRAVIRIITKLPEKFISEIGFTPQQLELLLKSLKKRDGLILIVGPTGSGKTVTLYNILSYLKQQNLNILTVCDPVEIELEKISQTSIEYKLNLDYPTILKAFLRQDPDVIMIGEIRDTKTLQIAIQAATTGHLVLSSIHTLDSSSAIQRLINLGVNKDNISENVSLIVAQRLIRKLCKYCKSSCNRCINGYRGLSAIYEIIDVKNLKLNKKITPDPGLQDVALSLVNQGITDLREIDRVLG